ncbi:MAG: hypothetical protein WD734_02050 [Dehalococcoidia bacterium]
MNAALRYDAAGVSGLRPERLLLVPRRVEDGRYLFAQWADWPYPAMLSTLPSREESLEAVAESVLLARLGVRVTGDAHVVARRLPVRMSHPRGGGPGLGWLRPVAVAVTGEPAPDGLLVAVDSLTFDEALAALPTDVEREALRLAADALDAQR